MTATTRRGLWAVVISEPLELAAAQPHQVLISVASVALMGQFASSGGVLHPAVGYLLAIGVEWAYLRGLATDAQAPTRWGAALNWSAALIVMLWGTLWCLKAFGALPETPDGWLAWALALAHVGPIAWLSLCAAQTHRAGAAAQAARQLEREQAEREQAERRQAERDALELETERRRRDLALWGEAQRMKRELSATGSVPAATGTQPVTAGWKRCATCNRDVPYSTPSEAGVIARRGCAECREARRART